MQLDLFAQSKSLEVTRFDCRKLAAVRILRIPYIHLLELINGQTLFRYWFYVFFLSDEFVGFYFLQVVELYLLITRVSTCGALLSQMSSFIPIHWSQFPLISTTPF